MNEVTYGWGFPPNISIHGAEVDNLIIVLHYFMIALFIGWGIFFVYCLVRFRSRPGHKANYEGSHSNLPKYLEVGVALFEAFLLVGVSYPLWSKMKYELPNEKDAVTIRIVAQQFAWNFHYAGKDGIFGQVDPKFISSSNPLGINPDDPAGKDDISTVNQLHFPINKPILAKVTSKDVIHSFSVPVLRVKQDAIPGMSTPIWWEANKTGQFEIVCAQLCGVGHTRMIGYVTSETEEEFNKWLNDQAPTPPQASNAETPKQEGHL